MSNATIDANKALVLAHYDAVTNRHDPEAIRAQLAPDFFDHAAGKRLSAEDVIAHSAAMHETFADLSAVAECLVAERDIVAGRFVWRGRHRSPWRGIQPTGRHVEFPRHDVLADSGRQDFRALGRDRFCRPGAAAQGLIVSYTFVS
ncbi:ester cyclase [Bradyrhizobium elkanii]|uniref:ester cyclase n=1 Tax=Bradyrhizobium elkanii TaxID=29448 RepID=UPI003516344D